MFIKRQNLNREKTISKYKRGPLMRYIRDRNTNEYETKYLRNSCTSEIDEFSNIKRYFKFKNKSYMRLSPPERVRRMDRFYYQTFKAISHDLSTDYLFPLSYYSECNHEISIVTSAIHGRAGKFVAPLSDVKMSFLSDKNKLRITASPPVRPIIAVENYKGYPVKRYATYPLKELNRGEFMQKHVFFML